MLIGKFFCGVFVIALSRSPSFFCRRSEHYDTCTRIISIFNYDVVVTNFEVDCT